MENTPLREDKESKLAEQIQDNKFAGIINKVTAVSMQSLGIIALTCSINDGINNKFDDNNMFSCAQGLALYALGCAVYYIGDRIYRSSN